MFATKEAYLVKSGDVVKVEVATAGNIRPGGYYFLRVPAVSALEWHPFSIACADGERVSFYVKVRVMERLELSDALFRLCINRVGLTGSLSLLNTTIHAK